ncbi:hypothetical protein ColTof4_03565 [Colletotrichum tofieldiae]|nr:hypothetical protein ColTof3_13012 [Colletotrichum tofieldiae]GKT71142.1 hypothetical protein ColTof4_03565 [Colletotrichum tofieldiae]GKT93947.1 hypothetical protein Ct61P_11797 [Colletotrichum tofieldiae]
MILDALKGVAKSSGKSIDEVLQAVQKITQNNLVKTEPTAADKTFAHAKPADAAANASNATAAKASASKPAAAKTAATNNKRPVPKGKGLAAKRTAPKVKTSASGSDTASNASADEGNANQFTCEFSGCSRVFLHRSSRIRVSVPTKVLVPSVKLSDI